MHLDSIDKPDTDQKSTVIIRWGPEITQARLQEFTSYIIDNRRVRCHMYLGPAWVQHG